MLGGVRDGVLKPIVVEREESNGAVDRAHGNAVGYRVDRLKPQFEHSAPEARQSTRNIEPTTTTPQKNTTSHRTHGARTWIGGGSGPGETEQV